MAHMDWTESQKMAITARNETLLVCAAAGSGKTAVLTERIIRRITEADGLDLSELLILTFTRAAAGEMKDRIRTALTEAVRRDPENQRAIRGLSQIDNASIGTIDSFFMKLTKAHFAELGLDAASRIADEASVRILKKRVMDEAISRCYEMPDAVPGFGTFADSLVNDRDDLLCDLFISIYDHCMTLPSGVGFLQTRAEKLIETAHEVQTGKIGFLQSEFGRVALHSCRLRADGMIAFSRQWRARLPEDHPYLDTVEWDLAQLERIRRARTLGELKNGLTELQKKRLDSKKGVEPVEAYKNGRDKQKKDIKKCLQLLPPSEEAFADSLLQYAQMQHTLYAFLQYFDQRFSQEKRSRCMLDFTDTSRMAYRLLNGENGEETQTAKQCRQTYKEIYIDEYQDINELQDAVFCKICTPSNRFLVGDVKQSIYGFRGSAPKLISEYRQAISEGKTECAQTVFLSENFRSSEQVLAFCNAVCDPLFGAVEQLHYEARDRLVHSRTEMLSEHAVPHIAVLPYSERAEENYIADQIEQLVRTGKYRMRDIAVLARDRRTLSSVQEVLSARHIRTYNSDARSLLENAEVSLVRSLLLVIDNPTRDAELAGVLRSPFYGATLNDLATVRNHQKTGSLYHALCAYTEQTNWECGKQFLADLRKYRRYARGHSGAELMRYLIRECSALSLCYGHDGTPDEAMTRTRRANLMLLYEYARTCGESGFENVYDLNRFLDALSDEQITLSSASAGGGEEDCVQLMTIHKSKGLQFPVVFVCGCNKSFFGKSNGERYLFSPEYGIYTLLRRREGMIRYAPAVYQCVKQAQRDAAQEEQMRVLYVALTRAQEELYVVGKLGKRQSARDRSALWEQRAPWDPYAYSTYLDWILRAAADADRSLYDLSLPKEDSPESDAQDAQLPQAIPVAAPKLPPDGELPVADQKLIERLERDFAFVYPQAELTALPAKMAVSRLYPGVLDEEDGETDYTLFGDETDTNALSVRRKMPSVRESNASLKRLPAFLTTQETEGDAAIRGTATHCFMQFCDFDAVRQHGAAAECRRLVEQQYLDGALAQFCDTEQIDRCIGGAFFERVRTARRVWREMRFNITLPASAFTDDPSRKQAMEAQTLLVQGVMDLVMEDADGKLILVDYKTDRFPPQTDRETAEQILRRRHTEQLSYYAEACRQIFCREVDACFIYSFALADTVSVRLHPVH